MSSEYDAEDVVIRLGGVEVSGYDSDGFYTDVPSPRRKKLDPFSSVTMQLLDAQASGELRETLTALARRDYTNPWVSLTITLRAGAERIDEPLPGVFELTTDQGAVWRSDWAVVHPVHFVARERDPGAHSYFIELY